jgi:hypothetical protein
MNENAYRDHVLAIHAEVVCKESMNNASQETKQFYEVEEDGNYIILVFQLTRHGDEASMVVRKTKMKHSMHPFQSSYC